MTYYSIKDLSEVTVDYFEGNYAHMSDNSVEARAAFEDEPDGDSFYITQFFLTREKALQASQKQHLKYLEAHLQELKQRFTRLCTEIESLTVSIQSLKDTMAEQGDSNAAT